MKLYNVFGFLDSLGLLEESQHLWLKGIIVGIINGNWKHSHAFPLQDLTRSQALLFYGVVSSLR